MHKDVIKVETAQKPIGKVYGVYYSSISNNTHRFMEKLGIDKIRIPYDLNEEIRVNQDYVLFTPTYGGGGEHTEGSVPKQVIKFLNNPDNRKYCRGVIASGNTNFGDTFALAGPILSHKLQVPLLYQFELLGTVADVKNIRSLLMNFWGKNE